MDDIPQNLGEQEQQQSQQNQPQQSSGAKNAMQVARRAQQAQKAAKTAKLAVAAATSETIIIPVILLLANKKNAKRMLYVILGIVVLLVIFFGASVDDGEDQNQNVSVSLQKTAPPEVENGKAINYSLKVSYSGSPTQIIVKDKIPDNTDYVSSGGPGNPKYDAATRTVTWTVPISSGTGTGSTSGAGCTKVSDPAGADWAQINSLDSLFLEKVNEVNGDLGVCVPVNLIKALVYLESGGGMLDPNGAGYSGIMQVGPGSWCDHVKYNIQTPEGNVGCGVSHLAHTYQQCNNSWEGSVTAYYAGHCIPNGAHDNIEDGGSGKTDQQYRDEIIARWKEIDAL